MCYNVSMHNTSITFRTDLAKRETLDEIARSMDRNRNWILNEAVDQYIEHKRWQLEEIAKGIADSDAGRSHSMEEVRAHFAKKTKK
jgi:predicted transcriptional regulator